MRALLRPTAALLVMALSACSASNEAAASDSATSESTASSSLRITTGVTTDSAGVAGGAARGPIDQPDPADLSNGTISITTIGGGMVMGIRHDSILVAFSDSVRREVRAELAKSNKSGDGDSSDALGRMIEGIVKKSVSAGLSVVFDNARGFPVADLKDARYEKNTIVFNYRKKPALSFVDLKENNVPFLAHFPPADAERFVSAVRSRLRANQ